MFSLECSTCASLPHVRKHDRGGRSRATRPIRNTTSALLLKNTVWIITTVVYDMKKIFPQMMTLAMLLCEGLLSGPLGPGRSPPSPSWHTPTPSVTCLDTETSTLSDWEIKWITRKALYLFDRTQNIMFPHMSILSDTVVTCDLRSLVLRLVVPVPKDEVVTNAAHFRSKGFHQNRAHSHACDVGNSYAHYSRTLSQFLHILGRQRQRLRVPPWRRCSSVPSGGSQLLRNLHGEIPPREGIGHRPVRLQEVDRKGDRNRHRKGKKDCKYIRKFGQKKCHSRNPWTKRLEGQGSQKSSNGLSYSLPPIAF